MFKTFKRKGLGSKPFKGPRMVRLSRSRKVRTIAASMAVTSLLYYVTSFRMYPLQEFFTRLYYIPIILGAVWFGLRGGILVSLAITLICIPHVIMASNVDQALFYDELLEVFLFNLVGVIAGALRDRERRQVSLNQKLQALAVLGEAVSYVAHEIKNMLIPIRGFLRRIREKQTPDDKTISYLEIVDQETAKLERMVKDMLSFGRDAPLEKEAVEVGPLVEEVRKILEEEFRDKGVKFVCLCPEVTKPVSMDRDKISHALTNLLHNAIQASPKGKEVRVRVRTEQDILQLVVEDEGAGIAEEHMDRLFQAFFTTKPQGTGLGLVITKQIVEQHGGEIRIESTPGKGTRVFLTFPVN
jgi:two-component system sensor histidine kinase HydH